jgi:hypothetical protein
MSFELYDLAQRLHAASTGIPAARSRYAPCLPPTDPIAVTIDDTADGPVLTAATTTATGRRPATDGLGLLADLGANSAATHRTLVVPDRSTLRALATFAAATPHGHREEEQAAVISWWLQRAEHPGSGAVLVLTEACSARWTLGTAPQAERNITTWCRWLGAQEPTAPTLLDLARRVADGATLPGLLDLHAYDSRSWTFHRERLQSGRSWRALDGRMEAALGLATRSDAADLYASLRLGDPLVALRESHDGGVVTGTITHTESSSGRVRRFTVAAPRLVCRLRSGAQVEGWSGTPLDLPDAAVTFTGLLTDTRVGRTGPTTGPTGPVLLLSVDDTVIRPNTLALGDTVCIRPRAVSPRQQTFGRTTIRMRYRLRSNWLAQGATPPIHRRDVPLDVAVAAAEE